MVTELSSTNKFNRGPHQGGPEWSHRRKPVAAPHLADVFSRLSRSFCAGRQTEGLAERRLLLLPGLDALHDHLINVVEVAALQLRLTSRSVSGLSVMVIDMEIAYEKMGRAVNALVYRPLNCGRKQVGMKASG